MTRSSGWPSWDSGGWSWGSGPLPLMRMTGQEHCSTASKEEEDEEDKKVSMLIGGGIVHPSGEPLHLSWAMGRALGGLISSASET